MNVITRPHITILFFLLLLAPRLGWSQVPGPDPKQADFVFKTYPLRYLYGVNAGVDVLVKNGWWVGLMYGDHDRAMVWSNEMALPELMTAKGFTMRLNVFHQEPGEIFYQGGYFGIKSIQVDSASFEPNEDFVFVGTGQAFLTREQWNTYFGYRLGLRKQTLGFGVDWFFAVGAVYRQVNDVVYTVSNGLPGGSQVDVEFISNYHWLPHVMTGLAITFGG